MPLDPDFSPTRRQVIAGAAVTGVAVAAGGALAAPASAAPAAEHVSASEEPVVAHVRDPRTGDIDLYVGERHVSVRDRDLAARLAAAAR